MAIITLKGNPINTAGDLPMIGEEASPFTLTKTDLSELQSHDFKNINVVLNIFPSIDTAVCAASVRKFNEEASALPNTKVLCISADLPFAHKRFCELEGLHNVIPLSVFRHPEFGKQYGVTILDGPLAGLLARTIIIIDKMGRVLYQELVPEITQEPNYEEAILAISKLCK